jgi:hypothetical protein
MRHNFFTMDNKCRTISIGLFFAIVFYCNDSLSQIQLETTETISYYLDLKHKWVIDEQRGEKLVGFLLTNIDTSGNSNWKSNIITSFEMYDKTLWTYFIKVNLPNHVFTNSKELWCTALVTKSNINQIDTIKLNSGGVRLSNITLELISNPKCAEVFIIPNRIWQDKIERSNWQNNDADLEKYRVGEGCTDVKAAINQTVYVVLFKLNNTFIKRIHDTKPASIEQQQRISVNF